MAGTFADLAGIWFRVFLLGGPWIFRDTVFLFFIVRQTDGKINENATDNILCAGIAKENYLPPRSSDCVTRHVERGRQSGGGRSGSAPALFGFTGQHGQVRSHSTGKLHTRAFAAKAGATTDAQDAGNEFRNWPAAA